jgi:hypothetical protein
VHDSNDVNNFLRITRGGNRIEGEECLQCCQIAVYTANAKSGGILIAVPLSIYPKVAEDSGITFLKYLDKQTR